MERAAGRNWTFTGSLPACSPETPVRWGGFALVAGGTLGIVSEVLSLLLALGVLSHLSPGYEYFHEHYRGKRLLNVFYDLPGPLAALLVAAGQGGVYSLLALGGKRIRLARTGLIFAASSAVLSAVPGLYRALTQPPPFPYGSPEGTTLSEMVPVATSLGVTAGVLMLGVAAARARGLGRSRVLPLVLGLLGAASLPYLYSAMAFGGEVAGFAPAVVVGSSGLLLNAGWVLLGFVLVGARSRERALVEAENLALARRLYEEAWGNGNVGVIRTLAAPDLVDHHHGQHGPDSFERSAGALRRSFPDLLFVLEDQRAEGESVMTRWTASGTDLGGVLWYPPTGKAATFSGVYTDRFYDGKLVEHWGESDTAGLLEQLGLPSDR
jgi:predicted ester cyclase